MNLEGKKCLVTGGAGHLGAAMTRALAKSGASVVIGSRDLVKAKELTNSFEAEGLSVKALELDVTSEESVNQFAPKLIEHFDGELHGIVNNAYSGAGGSIWTQTPKDYLHATDLVLGGAVRLLHSLRGPLEKAGDKTGASLVNISSMYGTVSPDPKLYENGLERYHNPPAYGAAKAALIQWTKYCATHLADHGIRSNAVLPGPFPSKQVQAESPLFIDRLTERVPVGRVGAPRDLEGIIALLISDAGSYLNGAIIPVDGGWTAL